MPRNSYSPNIPSMEEMLYDKKPTKTKRPIDKNTRDAVWIKYMGNKVEGKCYCCKIRTIHITHFQVGHNKARAKGGKDNISNLRPICGPCNRGMGTMSIETYRKKYFTKTTKKKPSTKKKTTKKKTTKKKAKGPFDIDWKL